MSKAFGQPGSAPGSIKSFADETVSEASGNVAATNVQGAIEELDAEKAIAPTTNGTIEAGKAVVPDSNKDASDFRNIGVTGAITAKGGATAAAAILRSGKTATEGLEVKVIDEVVTLTNAVETDLTNTVPAGAVILSVQANLDTLIEGDESGDDLGVKVGIGVTGDPDKYGITGDLLQNSKANKIPDWAVLGSEEQICVKLAKTDGSAATEKFVAGGEVRVRVVYLECVDLDDAA